MSEQKKKNIISLFINGFIFISTMCFTAVGLSTGASEAQPGQEFMAGLGYLKAFTVLSNIFAAFCSFIVVVINVTNLTENKDEMPYWVALIQFISATAVSLTFLTVVFFLNPVNAITTKSFSAYFKYFEGSMFFLHFFNPVLSALSFIFLERACEFKLKENLLALIPTVLYSVVYVITVVFVKCWPDFYGFTFGGKMYLAPVSIVMMYTATFFIAKLLIKLHNRKQN